MRRRWLGGALLVVVLTGGAGAWYWLRPPALPAIDLEGADAEVRAAIEAPPVS